MRVELIYDTACPNIESTRRHLLKAFAKLKLIPHWIEWERNHPETPDHAKQYGSPTILIDGEDLNREPPSIDNSCRLYQHQNNTKMTGVPTIELIVASLWNSWPQRIPKNCNQCQTNEKNA